MSAAPFLNPVADRAAFLRLAWLQRGLSKQYRAWAGDTRNPDNARRYGDEAYRLEVDSRWHFRRALRA